MIIYYGSYSITDGEEYLIGYEEGNPQTGNVIIKEIKNNKDEEPNGYDDYSNPIKYFITN